MRTLLFVLCAASLFMVMPSGAAADSGAAKDFKLGSERFAAKDYPGAIAAFSRAYRKRPHFLVLCNIARCYEREKKPLEAAKFYQRCLSEGAARKRRTARQVRRALRSQRRLVARVRVEVPDGAATLFVDGKRMGKTPADVRVNPGKHTFEAQRRGHKPAVAAVALRPGERRKVSLRPTPLPRARESAVFPTGDRRDPPARDEPTPSIAPEEDPETRVRFGAHPAWFWVSAAATTALAVVATVLGVQALGKKSDYEDNPTRGGYNEAVDSRLLANILWGVTAAAAAGTTVLFFVTDFSGGEKVSAGIDGFGIAWRGRF